MTNRRKSFSEAPFDAEARAGAGRAGATATEVAVTTRKLQEPLEVPTLEAASLDLDRPPTPRALQDAIHLTRLLAPVGHGLARAPGEREAGILEPRSEASGI